MHTNISQEIGVQGPQVGKWIERATSTFIQIPGPNPILRPGDEQAWDGGVIEACDVFKDGHTYYLYYHGTPGDEQLWPRGGYRLGVATAPSPLGPWSKYEGNPILDLGSEESWEARHVACASVIKEEEDRYYMWYSGCDGGVWSVGLATASDPLGPWKKYEGNPVLEDFGYVGGVVKVDETYRLYAEHPISASSPDQGPMALATADRPEGPWTKWEGNPVLPAGEWGAWDDGGYSEARVLYHEGVYHIFYGGTKWQKLESIGYAYSFDGTHFIKHPANPIGMRERNPDASAFAEVHALFEPPFVYAFHTLRYISRGGEDLGVQIFATDTPFRLAMPVLDIHSLPAGRTSELAACPPIPLERISDFSLTVECTYPVHAKAGLRVHIRASYDGIQYDTADLYTFDLAVRPERSVRETVALDFKVMFVKAIVENVDGEHDIPDVKVTASLGHR